MLVIQETIIDLEREEILMITHLQRHGVSLISLFVLFCFFFSPSSTMFPHSGNRFLISK